MKKILSLIVLSSFAFSANAFAESTNSDVQSDANVTNSARSSNFEGLMPSVHVGAVGYESTFSYSGTLYGSPYTSSHQWGGTATSKGVGLSYLKAVNDKWLVGAGVTYDFGSANVAKSVATHSGITYQTKATVKNHFSVYLQPTYAINEKSALFAKVGYHSIGLKVIDDKGQTYRDFKAAKTNLDGIGYGFGLMTFVDENVFVKAEMEFVSYREVEIPYGTGHNLRYKLDTAAGIVTLGYKF